MLASLDRLAALPAHTKVCCGHEYTLANCAFAKTLEPGNEALQARCESARHLRNAGLPSLPSLLADELACNPFLRIDEPSIIEAIDVGATDSADRTSRFAALRLRKDEFRG